MNIKNHFCLSRHLPPTMALYLTHQNWKCLHICNHQHTEFHISSFWSRRSLGREPPFFSPLGFDVQTDSDHKTQTNQAPLSQSFKTLFHPYNGSEWNSDLRFGGKSAAASKSFSSSFEKPFVFFCFGYFPGYFRHFFLTVQTHEAECQTSGCVGEQNLEFLHVTQRNLPAISRRFTQ